MKLTLLLLALFFLQEDTPLKPKDEFEIKLAFEFKDRGANRDPNKIEMDLTLKEYEKTRGSGPLPYLFLNLRILKQSEEEVRMRILENRDKVVMNKKFDLTTLVKLDLGFTDDIKDRVNAYEYTVFLMNADKAPVSKIIIYFEKDGTYFVNGEMRGKL